jgi:hypothetical protein
MKHLLYWATMISFVLGVLGCNSQSSNLSNEEILKRRAEQKTMKQGRRAQRPFEAELTGVKSKEGSPAKIKQAIESLPFVDAGSVSINIDENSATFRVKEGQELNEQEVKKAIEATGEAKVKRVGRMRNKE